MKATLVKYYVGFKLATMGIRTFSECARLCNCSLSHLSHVLACEEKNPRIQSAVGKLCQCPPEEIFGTNTHPSLLKNRKESVWACHRKTRRRFVTESKLCFTKACRQVRREWGACRTPISAGTWQGKHRPSISSLISAAWCTYPPTGCFLVSAQWKGISRQERFWKTNIQ